MNQAPVGLENGADQAASSRKNPVLFPALNQYNPNQIFQIGNGFGFFLIRFGFICCTIKESSAKALSFFFANSGNELEEAAILKPVGFENSANPQSSECVLTASFSPIFF